MGGDISFKVSVIKKVKAIMRIKIRTKKIFSMADGFGSIFGTRCLNAKPKARRLAIMEKGPWKWALKAVAAANVRPFCSNTSSRRKKNAEPAICHASHDPR